MVSQTILIATCFGYIFTSVKYMIDCVGKVSKTAANQVLQTLINSCPREYECELQAYVATWKLTSRIFNGAGYNPKDFFMTCLKRREPF